ncbi:MAG: UDP-N-acetylglucosamine--N-acetylmuramyl-(pentapeptide) pyrophosphoryl-undecaprenol N-acetylglucosamine transferase [Corynebacterium sp.]|nr:UDP-N-acetylglucosamine--N-acetylmuramyl-(pentapeptide) pyrophosphoryl-undecaprenol N-acetylglucosamine transferase [Corynebacterium sp.]
MLTVAVAGGGTAGHIEPAMAVADALMKTGEVAKVVALGTPRGLEKDLVPARGYELCMIDPVPVPRKINKDLFTLPFRVLKAIRQTKKNLADVDVVIGFGGYVSAPAYLASKSLKKPFFVHEANARAGMANKLGIKLGGRGLNSVENSGIPGPVVGVPIRNSFETLDMSREQACALWGLDPAKPVVLVTGGSQGAQSINRAVEAIAGTERTYQILHAYGKKNAAPTAAPGYVPVPYIDNMPAALRAADIVLCRCGAMTVAEVTQAHVPAIYIPLPIGNGEQALNAKPVVAAGGAVLHEDAWLKDADLNAEILSVLSKREAMAAALANYPGRDAAGTIARMIIDGVKGK